MLFSRRFRASTSQPQRMAGPAGPTPGFLRTCRDALPPTQPGVLAEGKVPLQPDALTRGCSSWPGDAEAVGIRHRSPLPSLPAHPWEPHLGRLWQLEHLGCEERPGGGGRETRPSACGQGQGQGHPHSGALPRTRGPAEVAVSSMRKRPRALLWNEVLSRAQDRPGRTLNVGSWLSREGAILAHLLPPGAAGAQPGELC